MSEEEVYTVFKSGDLFEDCDLRPCVCTIGNEGGDPHVSGVALTDGCSVFCSSTQCGLRPIEPEEIRTLRDAWFTRRRGP